MKNAEIFVGLDVGKSSFSTAVLKLNEPGSFLEQEFTNDSAGHKKLVQWLKNLFPQQLNNLLICLEHTGVYSRSIAIYLSEKEIHYTMISGLELKRSMGIRRGKSDKADAKDIAKYALLHRHELKHTVIAQQTILTLKDKLAERERMIKARTLLAQPLGEKRSALPAEKKSNDKHSNAVIKQITQAIKALDAEIEKIILADEEMAKCFKLLCSITGIGPLIAAHLIVKTQCFTCFENSRKLACYSGIAPFEYTSGTSIRGKTKVSHLADKSLKSILSMAALNAKRFDKEIKLYYERKKAEGKHTMVVMNAIKNKLLARAFAVVKRGTPYVQMATFSS